MNFMVHVSSKVCIINRQPSNSISCSDNALRLLVLMAGILYWGPQVTSSFSIWVCVLKGCYETCIFWRVESRLKSIEDFNLEHWRGSKEAKPSSPPPNCWILVSPLWFDPTFGHWLVGWLVVYTIFFCFLFLGSLVSFLVYGWSWCGGLNQRWCMVCRASISKTYKWMESFSQMVMR